MEINVGVSNHHVHLTDRDVEELFGKSYNLTKKRDLSQKGQYACEEVVSIRTDKGVIERVRVLGPTRKYTQVEVLKSDCEVLGINPPIRDSGDLENSENIIIVNGKKEIFRKNSCIIAARHIHANNEELKDYNTNDVVSIITDEGKIIDDVHIKKDPSYSLELHVDKDEAKLYHLENGDVVRIK